MLLSIVAILFTQIRKPITLQLHFGTSLPGDSLFDEYPSGDEIDGDRVERLR